MNSEDMAIRREVKMEKISLEEIKHLYYDKGMILKEIALKYNTSCGYIRKIMKRHKLKTIRGPHKYRKIIMQKSKIPLSIKETDIYQYVENIPSVTLEVIMGGLLGDSNINVRKNKNENKYNVCFGHSIKQLEYLRMKYELIGEGWRNPIREEKTNGTTVFNGRVYKRSKFYCFSTTPLNIEYIYNLLYVDRKKIVSRHYLDYLTPLSLAVWYMDDGSYSYNNRTIRFSTMGFTQQENRMIREYFYENLKIPCTLEKADCGYGMSICLPQNSAKKFLALTNPYRCDNLSYKFPINPSETLKANTTSICE